MAETQAAGGQAAAFTSGAETSLLDQILEQGKVGRDAETRERGKDLVSRRAFGPVGAHHHRARRPRRQHQLRFSDLGRRRREDRARIAVDAPRHEGRQRVIER